MSTLPENIVVSARDFYGRHLTGAFRCTQQFSEPLGRSVGSVLDTAEFGVILRECPIGSFDCARRIGELALVHLDRVPALAAQTSHSQLPVMPPFLEEWWRDLVNFERGCFLQAATTAEGPPMNRPRRGVSALCMKFSWAVSELADRIKAGETIPSDLRRPVTLIFARSEDGRVCVVEVGIVVERVFRATNGLRTVDQIAAAAGLSLEETTASLTALAGIGAVVPAMSPETMSRLISAREAGKK